MSAAPQAYAKPLPKPPASLLRKPLLNHLKKHLIIATFVGAALGFSYKIFVGDKRKENYKKFYQTWDSNRHYQRMVSAGVFQSVKPDKELPDWVKDYEKEVDKAIAALKK